MATPTILYIPSLFHETSHDIKYNSIYSRSHDQCTVQLVLLLRTSLGVLVKGSIGRVLILGVVLYATIVGINITCSHFRGVLIEEFHCYVIVYLSMCCL